MIPFLYAFICLIWGSTWLVIKIGSNGVPPFLAAGTAVLFWPHENISWLKLAAMASALAAAFAASVNLVVMKRHSRHTDIYIINGYGMAIGAVCLMAVSLLTESYARVSWNWANVLALLYLTVFGTVIAFLAYYSLVKVVDATLLSMVTLIFPLVAVALGWIFLNETISFGTAIGIITVLAGVAVATGLPKLNR